MAQLTPRFSTNRTVREYTEQHYLPAASAYQLRSADHGAIGKQIADWLQAVDREWDSLRFGSVRVDSDTGSTGLQWNCLWMGSTRRPCELSSTRMESAVPIRYGRK